MSRNRRSLILSFLASAFAGPAASAGLVTWEFGGTITNVSDGNNLLGGSVSVGTSFSGSFTFDTTTPDSQPADIVVGDYRNAVTSFEGIVGNNAFAASTPLDLRLLNDASPGIPPYDTYAVFGVAGMLGESLEVYLRFDDTSASMFSTDSIPLMPPSLDELSFTKFGIGRQELGLWISGDLTALTPEPTSLALLGLGTLVLIRRRRNRNRLPQPPQQRCHAPRFLATIVLVVLLDLPVSARAGLVTWEFEGQVTSFFDVNNLLGGSVSVGTPFSGSFTFDTTTSDSQPADIVVGDYRNAVTSFAGIVGDNEFAASTPLDLLVRNNASPTLSPYDTYGLSGSIDFLGESLNVFLQLLDSTASMFSTDSIPVTPPSLDGQISTAFGIGMQSLGVGISGDLTALTPEPTSLALLGLGTLLIAGRRKRPGVRREKTAVNPFGSTAVFHVRPSTSRMHMAPREREVVRRR